VPAPALLSTFDYTALVRYHCQFTPRQPSWRKIALLNQEIFNIASLDI